MYENNCIITELFVSVCSGSLDVVFVIDRTSCSSSEWTTIIMNINSLISTINSAFPISSNGTHIGIVTYTSIATTTLSLNDGKSLQSIQQSLNSVTSASSSSHNLLAALVAAENEMASNSRHQFQVVIAFIDSTMDNLASTVAQASDMIFQQMIVMPIPISPTVNVADLQSLASSPSLVAYVPKTSIATMWNPYVDLRSVLCPNIGTISFLASEWVS